MPIPIQGSGNISGGAGSDISLSEAKYDYSYPGELDWRPSSELHRKTLALVLERARMSHEAMSQRHPTWEAIDNTLTTYIETDDAEKKLKAADSRKPISIVVPISSATLDTILTYLVGVFLDSPLIPLGPVGPEDTKGVILLEKHIERQMAYYQGGLGIYTMLRDGFVNGIGAVSPIWKRDIGFVRNLVPNVVNTAWGTQEVVSYQEVLNEEVVFEGNQIQNINPYLYLPDPNVAAHHVQRGEFVGWVSLENRMGLLERENTTGDIFNAKYLKHIVGKSRVCSAIPKTKTRMDRDAWAGEGAKPIDVIWMYINLIPSEHGLSSRDTPERWLFGVAGDELVVAARPQGFWHNRFPVACCAPDSDGYDTAPLSRMEMLQGLQEVINFLFNSHIANIRKVLNDMLVVDPSLINLNDLMNPGPGRLIRTRKAQWGRGVKDAVQQLSVTDVTRQNVGDILHTMDIVQRVSGATDPLQGIVRQGSERRTAEEFRETRGAAISRIQMSATLIGMQAMQGLGYLIASQTQQLASQEGFLKVSGRWAQKLQEEFGETGEYASFNPADLNVAFDVEVKDGSSNGGENPALWKDMIQIASASPLLSTSYDLKRMFLRFCREAGVKNAEDYIQRLPLMSPQVVPDEQAAAMAQSGQIAPIDQVIGGPVG